MSFTRSRAARIGLLAGSVAVSAAAQLPAAAQSINATQLSIVVAPTKIVGIQLGGEITASGTGLATGTIPTLLANGAAGATTTAFTADANVNFNLDISVRAADVAATGGNLAGTGLTATAGQFGSQKGYFSDGSGGTLTISNQNAATISASTKQGTTATAVVSTGFTGLGGSTEYRRVATSSNDQATFDSTRQSARLQIGGSGLGAVTAAGNFGATALGAAGNISTVSSGGQAQANVAFTRSEVVSVGQGGSGLTASSTNVTNPAYGNTTVTLGGTSAGQITLGSGMNPNSLTVVGGGSGTSATLSAIQTMTAF